jgi:hypothetical protein
MLCGLLRLRHFPFTSVRVSCLSLYFIYVFFFPILFLPECLFVSVGSVSGSLASKEELAAGSRIGYAGLGMPPPPPPEVQPSPQPTGLNFEAPTCELRLFFVSLKPLLTSFFIL